MLLTGDTPVVTVSGTAEVTYGPMLLLDLHEVHLPVTPERLLTITAFPSLSPTTTAAVERRTNMPAVASMLADYAPERRNTVDGRSGRSDANR
jgi:hypothetical protein